MGACCSFEPRQTVLRGNYKAKILRVIDGDTVELAVRPYWDAPVFTYRARLHGIDTPELHPVGLNKETSKQDTPKIRALKDEKRRAEAAKQHLTELLEGRRIRIVAHGNEKYGRVLVELYYTSWLFKRDSLNKMMVDAGHAVPYSGGKR